MVAVGAAFGLGHAVHEAPAPVIHVPIPTVVSVPMLIPIAVPAPRVEVMVAPPVIEMAEPDESDEPMVSEKPRALAPAIDPTCIAPIIMREGDGTSGCQWDDGLPAISADGTRIVTWVRRGEKSVAMQFIDAATSRVVREERLVAKTELDADDYVNAEDRRRVKARIAALQAELVDNGYRTMIEPTPHNPIAEGAVPRGIRVEGATYEPAIRLVDGATQVQLWRGEFYVEDEYPAKPDADPADCYPVKDHDLHAWWDATTRTVFVEVSYQGPGDSCPPRVHHYIRHAH